MISAAFREFRLNDNCIYSSVYIESHKVNYRSWDHPRQVVYLYLLSFLIVRLLLMKSD
jgi:hypothetical protein